MTGPDEQDGFEQLRHDFPGWHFSVTDIVTNSGGSWSQYRARAPGMNMLTAISLTDLRALLEAAGPLPA